MSNPAALVTGRSPMRPDWRAKLFVLVLTALTAGSTELYAHERDVTLNDGSLPSIESLPTIPPPRDAW